MAPFKSEAQRKKFASMVKEGKMKQSTFDEWNSSTPANLPERVEKKDKKLNEYKKVKIGKVKVI